MIKRSAQIQNGVCAFFFYFELRFLHSIYRKGKEHKRMNKKELLETRKQITNMEQTSLREISLCYVSAEKEIVFQEKRAFLQIPEEEAFKYLEIFKKTLSGKSGKTLFHVQMDSGSREKELLKVVQEMNGDVLNAYHENIIDTYEMPGNFLIVTGHGFYDYASRLADGSFDEESDYTYEYMLTALCPVSLSKPGLSYRDGEVKERIRDWVVEAPKDAILYPTFTDRTSNVHEILYYSKNAKDAQDALLESLAGNNRGNSEVEDRAWFSEAVKKDNEVVCPFEVIKSFNEQATEAIEGSEGQGETFKSVDEIGQLLEQAGMKRESVKTFREYYEKNVDDTEISLNNLVSTDKAEIKGPGFGLRIDAGKLQKIITVNQNGRTCLAIPLESSFLEVNGIQTTVSK